MLLKVFLFFSFLISEISLIGADFHKVDRAIRNFYHKPVHKYSRAEILNARKVLPQIINASYPFPLLKNSQESSKALEKFGSQVLGCLLSEEQLQEIHLFLDQKPVYKGHTIRNSNHLIQGPIDLASCQDPAVCYTPYDIAHCPHLLEIATHPSILNTIESYFGCPPTLYDFNLLWILGGHGSHSTQKYHRDFDDFYQVTLFVYLTDVLDELSGPHNYLLGTHKGKEKGKSLFIFGKEGTVFLEDSFGKHRGTTPAKGAKRLMFWARYGLGKNCLYKQNYSFKDFKKWHLSSDFFKDRLSINNDIRRQFIFRLFIKDNP